MHKTLAPPAMLVSVWSFQVVPPFVVERRTVVS
jgi:hypothetical protein